MRWLQGYRDTEILTIRPAFSTFRANSAFSDKKPYPSTKLAFRSNTTEEQCSLTRVDHLSAMIFGDFDDLVASQISPDRGVLASLANDVGFIGLYFDRWSVCHLCFQWYDREEGQGARAESVVLCRCMLRRSS